MTRFYAWSFQRGRSRETLRDYCRGFIRIAEFAASLGAPVRPAVIPEVPAGCVAKRLGQPAAIGTLRHYWETIRRPRLVSSLSRDTIRRHDAAVANFGLFIGDDVRLDAVTDALLADFSTWLATSGYTPAVAKLRYGYIVEIVRSSRPGELPRDYHAAPNKINEGPAAEKSIRWLYESLYLVERELRQDTAASYRGVMRRFTKYLGRDAMLGDLNRGTVNQYLLSVSEKLRPATVRGHRAVLLQLWRMAFDEELLNEGPRRIRRIKVPRPVPDAWTADELLRLLGTTTIPQFDHRLANGAVAGDLLNATIRLCYDTGARRGDLFRFAWSDVVRSEAAARIVWIVSKNGEVLCRLISPTTLVALDRIRVDDDDRLLPSTLEKSGFQKLYRKLLAAAGLPVNRRNGLQKVRRTSASYLEAICPGTASAHLGHRSGDLARRHYLDPLLAYNPKSPPALPEVPKLLENCVVDDVGEKPTA